MTDMKNMYMVTITEKDKKGNVRKSEFGVMHETPDLIARAVIDEYRKEDEMNGIYGTKFTFDIRPMEQ